MARKNEKKESFIFYFSDEKIFKRLNAEQTKKLMDMIFDLAIRGKEGITDDVIVQIAFDAIGGHILRDEDKYKERCEKNAKIAREREEQKKKDRAELEAYRAKQSGS